jgi:hypothetical protein
MKKCIFCGKESTGMTQLDSWKFDTCSDWNCKRKKTIVFKILMNDLSDETILKIARVIPDEELYWKPHTLASPTFPTEKAINRNLKELSEDNSQISADAETSLNSDIIRSFADAHKLIGGNQDV